MIVSGVVLSAGAAAILARRLARAGHARLADDVGLAIDANWEELVLGPSEKDEIITVLADCPVLLRPLRDALRAKSHREGAP